MNYLMLVDKFNNVPVEYADTLKFYEVQGKLFEEQAGKQLERMLTAADSENIKIKVISGYRSPDYQQMLWERSISLEMWSGASYDEAIKKSAEHWHTQDQVNIIQGLLLILVQNQQMT